MSTLLAKSRTHGELTLERHLLDTEQAAMGLFRPGTRWGERWPAFFKVDASAARFLLELRVAALFHDIGKANDHFQRAVSATGELVEQTLRHEHMSALVMCLPEVREWLSRSSVDVDICTAAVLSHHLKAEDGEGDWRWAQFRSSPTLQLHLEHPQIRATLKRLAALLELPPPPDLPTGQLSTPFTGVWLEALKQGKSAATALRRSLPRDADRRRRLVAVKVGLIVSDSAASGLFRTSQDIDSWVDRVAHCARLSADEIVTNVIDARLVSIGAGATLHAFQLRAAESGPRTLLLAACGSGKTLAAWKWAEQQARDRPLGRVIFLYPTRGTATEGFRDYAGWAPEGQATLLHGSAAYELESMHENPPESAREKRLGPTEDESRLYALGLWARRYFSATVDQFLSAMEHRYEALCLLPALADAAVIIDEVHSFDRKMFDSLIAFLAEFDVPTLCMTATLPSGRRKELEAVGLRSFPSRADTAELADLQAKERAPRYRLRRVPDVEAALALATSAYRAGKRVLWVVNQVARAQKLTERLATALLTEVLCYHSRFRLRDRQGAHSRTVKAFQQTTTPIIAVTTQVCEMSLDLDADVLITEECPVTSLVQRFGRANRHLRKAGLLAELFTYPAERELPYSRKDLEGVGAFLAALDGRQICQADLALQIESLEVDEATASGASSLFDSGYYAVPREFRDIDDFARAAVISSDVTEVAALWKQRKSIDGFIVPVPRQFVAVAPAGLPSWLGIADAQHYQPTLGYIAPEREVS